MNFGVKKKLTKLAQKAKKAEQLALNRRKRSSSESDISRLQETASDDSFNPVFHPKVSKIICKYTLKIIEIR